MAAQGETAGCVLCRARDGADGAERLVVTRGELCFVVMNLYPTPAGTRW